MDYIYSSETAGINCENELSMFIRISVGKTIVFFFNRFILPSAQEVIRELDVLIQFVIVAHTLDNIS